MRTYICFYVNTKFITKTWFLTALTLIYNEADFIIEFISWWIYDGLSGVFYDGFLWWIL